MKWNNRCKKAQLHFTFCCVFCGNKGRRITHEATRITISPRTDKASYFRHVNERLTHEFLGLFKRRRPAKMTEVSWFVGDDTETVPAPRAPCNKCAFTCNRRRHERDAYRMDSRPRKRVLCHRRSYGDTQRQKECERQAEKTDR